MQIAAELQKHSTKQAWYNAQLLVREYSTHIDCSQPLYFPFCAGVQFSRDSLRAFNDRIKIQENTGQ